MSQTNLFGDIPIGGNNFSERYQYVCTLQGVAPYRPILPKLAKDTLELNMDAVTKSDLFPILHALVNDDSLVSIRLESRLLKENPQLTRDLRKIHLHSNVRLPAYTDPEIMASLCNALHRHFARNELNLKVLRLVGIPLGDSHLGSLCAGLRTCKNLKLVSLEGFPLSVRHLDVLLPSLPAGCQILGIPHCDLGPQECSKIAAHLQKTESVQRLILNANPIGDRGAEILVRVLQNKKSFRAIDIQNCGLTSACCFNLSDLLTVNPLIEVCDIRRNPGISRSSALLIAKTLIANSKFHGGKSSFRALPLDMSPPIEVKVGGAGDRESIPKVLGERSRVVIDPVPIVQMPTQQLREDTKENENPDEVVIPRKVLTKLETTLIKFQVLLDYLNSERSAPPAHATDPQLGKHLREHRPTTKNEPKTATPTTSSSSRKSSDRTATANRKGDDDVSTNKSYSDTFAASSTQSRVDQILERTETSESSSLKTTESTVKKASESDESGNETIVSEKDDFEFQFDDVGGITKESSYLRIANEQYEDPKILESTRASNETVSPPSFLRKASPLKSSDDVGDLQERLRDIQAKYNVVAEPLKALGNGVTKGKMIIDDITISESWVADARDGSIDVTDLSFGSSFSGDLTGSDLERF